MHTPTLPKPVFSKLLANPNCTIVTMPTGILIQLTNPLDRQNIATYYLDYTLGENISKGDTYYNRLVSWLSPACKACKIPYILNSPQVGLGDIG